VEKARFLWTLGVHWLLVELVKPASEWLNDSAMLLAAISGAYSRRVFAALDRSSSSSSSMLIETKDHGRELFVLGASLSAFSDQEGLRALGAAYGASSTEGLLLRSHHRFFTWGRLDSRRPGPLCGRLGNAIRRMRYTRLTLEPGLDKSALTTELAQLYLLEFHLQDALPRDEGILVGRE
jgi:hypothetical protein